MENDSKNFEIIFKKYYTKLCFYARKFVDNDSVAKDIVQEVFLNLWDKKQLIEIELVMRAYLFRSVYNRCLNHLEHRKMADRHHENINRELKQLEIEYYNASNGNEYSLFELELKIESAIESLPPQCRNVFELSRMKGLKNREIAAKLQISIKVVEKHISRALLLLRENLTEYLPLFLILAKFC